MSLYLDPTIKESIYTTMQGIGIAGGSNTITTLASGSLAGSNAGAWPTVNISGSSMLGTVGTVSASTHHNPTTLDVQGNASFSGEITIKGKKLSEVLENIEKRLAILHPNPELEEKWENLRGLREAYLELEKEIIEKEKVWAILKR